MLSCDTFVFYAQTKMDSESHRFEPPHSYIYEMVFLCYCKRNMQSVQLSHGAAHNTFRENLFLTLNQLAQLGSDFRTKKRTSSIVRS